MGIQICAEVPHTCRNSTREDHFTYSSLEAFCCFGNSLNFHVFLYGSQSATFFEVHPPSLSEYLDRLK